MTGALLTTVRKTKKGARDASEGSRRVRHAPLRARRVRVRVRGRHGLSQGGQETRGGVRARLNHRLLHVLLRAQVTLIL